MFNIIDALRRWRAENAAITALRKLDDHLLADIGVSRADISRNVRGRK